MNMQETIRAFFSDAAANGKHIGKELRNSSLDLVAAEGVSVSEHSPGRVTDEETLARLVFTPLFLDEDTGGPTTAALKDAATRGLSVDRLELVGQREVHQRRFEKEKTTNARKGGVNPVSYAGFVHVPCGAVRGLWDDEDIRQFFVFDTATTENHAHADICHARFANDLKMRLARTNLMKAFRPVVRP